MIVSVVVTVPPELGVRVELARVVVKVGDGSPRTVRLTVGDLLLRELTLMVRVALPPGAAGGMNSGETSSWNEASALTILKSLNAVKPPAVTETGY